MRSKPTKAEIIHVLGYLGKKTSEKKANASRINGRKGGRPKKKIIKTLDKPNG